MSDPQAKAPAQSTDEPAAFAPTLPTQASVPSTDVPVPAASPDGERPLPAIAGYVIECELGRGGMGVVYKARQQGLGRFVALKMILHANHAQTEDRLRFLREAEALARLRHENIVQVYEVGEHEGKPFISLEYVEGGSLDRHLRGTPLPPREAARLVRPLADAVQTAHDAGIIHRDLKPANVLLASGVSNDPGSSTPAGSHSLLAEVNPKITDFGLAKREDGGKLSVSGAVLGTPSYMAPEQAAGKEVDARADVYALGAILYECLTGRPPFRAATPMDTMLQVMHDEPVSVRSLQPGTPQDLETICLKCLQKEPRKRYGTARALTEELGRFLRGEPVQARPVGRLERSWRWCRRNPVTAGLLAGIALLLVTVAAVSSVLGRLAWLKAEEADFQAREALQAREAEATKAKAERQARLKADQEEQNAKRLLYVSRLTLVQSLWDEGKVAEARDTLIDVEEHRDMWEHRYLNTLLKHRGQRTFLGQTSAVNAVSFSPDGKRIASGGGDQTVKVWDVASGQDLLTLKGHTDSVRSVSFSPDGKRIASGSSDHTVKLWDAASGQDLLTLKGHTDSVRSVSFSRDGNRIVSGSEDRTVKVWDAGGSQDLLTLKGHNFTVYGVSFSPDGKRIASGSFDKTVKVWDATSGQDLLTLKGHTHSVYSVAFSPDGHRIASGSFDKTVKVWDAASGQELLTLVHTDDIWGVWFCPDGKHLVTSAGSEKKPITWDLASGQPIAGVAEKTVSAFPRSPDGRFFALAEGKVIHVHRLPHGKREEAAERRWWVDPDPRWHEKQAQESWQAVDWFAAAFHLERLLAERPWDAELHVRRAYTLGRLARTREAAVHHLRAILLQPQVNPCGHWTPTPPGEDEPLPGPPTGPALTDFELAAHQPNAPFDVWADYLLAARAAGAKETLRIRRELLDRFEKQADTAARLVFCCRESPCEESFAARLIKLAEGLVARERNASNLDWLGSALYRAGRFEEAARTLEESNKVHGKGGYVDTWLFQAMTQQRLGQPEEARRNLGRFEAWRKGRKFATWQERERWRLLNEEARALILTMPRTAE